MTEEEFLRSYSAADFARPSLTVDCVLLSVVEGEIAVLVQTRAEHPFKGVLALPGSFVGIDEGLEDAARRVLADKAGGAEAWLEQLYTFGAPDRDPRMRVISVAWFALVDASVLADAVIGAEGLSLHFPLRADAPKLAFDHTSIVAAAIERLRGKLDYAPLALALLPESFTLRALQEVHEAILGRPLNKPAFRRRMLDSGWIEATGIREEGGAFRPAELYRAAVSASGSPTNP